MLERTWQDQKNYYRILFSEFYENYKFVQKYFLNDHSIYFASVLKSPLVFFVKPQLTSGIADHTDWKRKLWWDCAPSLLRRKTITAGRRGWEGRRQQTNCGVSNVEIEQMFLSSMKQQVCFPWLCWDKCKGKVFCRTFTLTLQRKCLKTGGSMTSTFTI